jgi:hypothetical protein
MAFLATANFDQLGMAGDWRWLQQRHFRGEQREPRDKARHPAMLAVVMARCR